MSGETLTKTDRGELLSRGGKSRSVASRNPLGSMHRIVGNSRLRTSLAVTAVFFVFVAIAPNAGILSAPTLTDGLVFLILCYAWNLVGGFLGELSLAHMIFWGIGGYGITIAVNHSFSVPIAVVLLIIGGAVAGALVVFLVTLAGVDGLLLVAIFTLVLGEIAVSVATGMKSLGGSEGLIALQLPSLSANAMYGMVIVIAVLAAIVNIVIASTRIGTVWLAIRDDAEAASAAGINVLKNRTIAYVISAAICALGGAYQSYYAGYARPDVALSIAVLILVTLAVFVGGPGTALGPLIGAVLIYGLQIAVQEVSSDVNVSLYAQVAEFLAALLLLRFVLPRTEGQDLLTALARFLRLDRLVGRTRSRVVPDSASAPADHSGKAIVDVALSARSDRGDTAGSGLELKDVRKSFGALQVLRGVSFDVRRGEVVGVVGPNGAGKSTICNLVSGLMRVSDGDLDLDDRSITGTASHQRARQGVGRSFQTPRLFRSLLLSENLAIAGHMDPTRAAAVLDEIGVPRAGRRTGADPEFYARRLVEVARACIQADSVLLLDEPLAGLTPDQHQVVLEMARGAADAGAAVIIVEHLIPVLAPAVDRVVVLAEGRIIADGPPKEVLQMDSVLDAYLGRKQQKEAS